MFRMAGFVCALAAGAIAGRPSHATPIERHFMFDDDGVIVGSGAVKIDSAFYHGFPVEYFTPNEGLLSLDFTIYGVHFDLSNARKARDWALGSSPRRQERIIDGGAHEAT